MQEKLPEKKPTKKPRTQKQIEWAKQLGQNSNKFKQQKQSMAKLPEVVPEAPSTTLTSIQAQTEQVTYIIIGLAIFLGGSYLYFKTNKSTNANASASTKPNYFNME